MTSHTAILQAAGTRAGYVGRIVEGEIQWEDLAPGERAIAILVRKSAVAPACLEPADLREIVPHFGVFGSLEIVAVLAAFHFVNRIANLAGLSSDFPIIQQR